MIAWINSRVYDETKDAEKSQGWCPLVVDTTGDGKISANRKDWLSSPGLTNDMSIVGPLGAEIPQGDYAKKDTRLTGFVYGINVSPVDDSVWGVKYIPIWPSGIVRMVKGSNPPETCRTEYYEPPKLPDGTYAAFGSRGIDIDSKGVAWVSFANGQIGGFDRGRCNVTNGPNIGQTCPEGWTIYDPPGPHMTGQKAGTTDFFYQTFVDLYDTSGLGKDAVVVTGANSDSLVAFLPESKQFVTLRVPYPMGMYARLVDGRIDDAGKGWKGRGLWANYGSVAYWHQETADENPISKVVQIQVRPDPLAK